MKPVRQKALGKKPLNESIEALLERSLPLSLKQILKERGSAEAYDVLISVIQQYSHKCAQDALNRAADDATFFSEVDDGGHIYHYELKDKFIMSDHGELTETITVNKRKIRKTKIYTP